MIKKNLQPSFEDSRGVITDILQHTPVDSVTLITCTKGAIRGNHYHKASIQFTYVISGKIRAYTQFPEKEVPRKELSKKRIKILTNYGTSF